MELTRLKRRLKTALRGHKLLKDKRDEMVRQFISLSKRHYQLRNEVEDALTGALAKFSLSRAVMGEAAMREALFYPARAVSLKAQKRNMLSVTVPFFTCEAVSEQQQDLPYGFAYTSGELDEAVLALTGLLPSLVELAQVEKTCSLLADEIEKTRRRVNALEYVMIPETEDAIKYITMKLEENDRASLVRLMKAKEIIGA
jgi:V/A-type H+-transporting ATPase subunit D